MDFKITPELAITLSSDNLSLYVLPYQEGSSLDPDNCPPTIDFRSYELKDGITMQLITKQETGTQSTAVVVNPEETASTQTVTTTVSVNYLKVESGLIPPAAPSTALKYEIASLDKGWPNISLKMINDPSAGGTNLSNKMAATLLTMPEASDISCLPSNKISLSNVQTDIITIDFNLVNYVQVTSDGTKLTMTIVY